MRFASRDIGRNFDTDVGDLSILRSGPAGDAEIIE
jgi:hypothetical protein